MKTTITLLALASGLVLNAQDMVKRTYHANGAVKEEVTEDGFRTYFTAYHTNGVISQRGSFWKNELDGTWNQYDEKGGLVCRVRFDKGHRTGVWVVNQVDGRDKLVLRYKADKLQRAARRTGKGELVVERVNR
jgi:antitoxin component YwqK of YwqJK toxin-antitoxin module